MEKYLVWISPKSGQLLVSQVSISSTFYTSFFCHYFVAKNYKAEMFGFVILLKRCNFLAPKFCTKDASIKRWWNWLQVGLKCRHSRRPWPSTAWPTKTTKQLWLSEESKTIFAVRTRLTSSTPKARCQFHQHFTAFFFVQKCFAQLFSTYSLAL